MEHLSNKTFNVLFDFTLPVFVIVCSTTGVTRFKEMVVSE